RSGRPGSLEQREVYEVPAREQDNPDVAAAAPLLRAIIDEILRAQPDHRLQQIFHLWAVENQRIVDIGKAIHLSEARVRVLLQQAVTLLRSDPRVRDWLEELNRGDN